NDRSGIRGYEILTFANTDYHRTSLPGSNKLIGTILTHDHNRIGTNHFIQSQAHSLQQVSGITMNIFYQVNKNLGIRITTKYMTLCLQSFFDDRVVLDNAVVNNRK